MRLLKYLLSFVILIALVSSCRKDTDCQEAQELKLAMKQNDVNAAGVAITKAIASLPSKTYNQQNIQALVADINSKCSMSASMLCFSCIKTLPEQTEIRVTFIDGNATVTKTFDISYRLNNPNIIFVSMHD